MDGERCPENDEADMRKVQLNPSQIKTQQERKRVFKDLQRPEAKTEQLGEAWALAVAASGSQDGTTGGSLGPGSCCGSIQVSVGGFTAISVAHQGRFHPVPRLKLARQM
jgi:hypothetical protein